MIRIDSKEITVLYYGQRAIAYVYQGSRLVWQKVKEALSCFGSGKWLNDRPWIDTDLWKNN